MSDCCYLAATNRPEDLDEAVRRRFAKRIYVPLPDLAARTSILKELLGRSSSLSDKDIASVASALEGYSASDVTAIVKDAALGPIRELGRDVLFTDTRNIRLVKLVTSKQPSRGSRVRWTRLLCRHAKHGIDSLVHFEREGRNK